MNLSQFIVADMEGILQDWEEFARTLPGAQSMERKALRDHAEKILRTIAKDIDDQQSTHEEVSKSKGRRDTADGAADDSAAQRHGDRRLEEGFSLPEMAAEFRALRASVIRRWRARNDLPHDALDQAIRFSEGIDQALAESVQRFWNQLNRSRELFMGALGHDLRGPLQIIRSAAGYLRKPETAQRTHAGMVEYIQESAERIQSLIDDLLDVAQTKLGGQLPINPKPSNAGEICKRVVAGIQALHVDREIRIDCDGSLSGVWDAGRLEQLISNLVRNAIQHGDARKPVSIRLRGDDERLIASVHNEGTPIPERVKSRVFEPLIRGEQSEPGPNADGNMGLGLYIACSVVRAHQGSIEVESSEADGTTFTVRLPKQAWTTVV